MLAKIEQLVRDLGLPVSVAAIIVAVAGYFGLPLETVVQLFGVLVGLPFVWALVVDLLKGLGIVQPGDAGKWSAAFNLISIIGLAVLLKFLPSFDVVTWDAQLLEVAKAVVLIVTWIMQLFGTKGAHRFYVNGLGIRRFSFAKG